MIHVEDVRTKKQLKSFIDFPHKLYRGDQNYVPELFISQKDLFNPGKHPFHEHSFMQLFLVYENYRIKGRIAAIMNTNYNSFNHALDGFFGFFECVDNKEIAKVLFSSAIDWLNKHAVENIIGPVNPSTNEPCGLLINGFDTPPVAMTVYNKPYYNTLLEAAGFTKKVDLLAYDIAINDIDDRPVKIEQELLERLKRKNISIRSLNRKDYKNEVVKIREVYNKAWENNMGFVPLTTNEFNYLANDLKMIVDEKLCLLAEHDGKPIGFALAIPDVNQVLIKIKNGRLLPIGFFRLLFGLKKINNLRVLALGVLDGYKKQGIEACFYASIIKRAIAKKMRGAEASWMLENNVLMTRGIESMNGKLYKKYRIYNKVLHD